MEQVQPEPQTNPAKYHHVATWKFLLLATVTLGVYELYWFYKNWRYIRERDQSRILPFWRAFFSPIWFYSIAQDIDEEKTDQNTAYTTLLLALFYFLLSLSWRLPDPYWLVAFLTPFVILPLVRSVHEINRRAGVKGAAYSRFSILHIAATVIGLPIVAISLVTSSGILPNTQVMSGDQLPNRVVSMLESTGLIEEGEEVIYYYSGAMISYANDGNYFTKNQVVSYWKENGELYAEQARYQDIEDIQVEYSESFLDDTIVTILRTDGTEFILLVSAEADKDHDFVAELKTRWVEGRGNPQEKVITS